jgi:hypothetical protein
MNGGPIPGQADTETAVIAGDPYSKAIPPISGYAARGYKVGAPPTGEGTFNTGGPAEIAQVDADTTVYFVYEKVSPVDLVKVDAENTDAGLAGAQFKLYRLLCAESGHGHLTDPADVVDLDSPGPCWAALEEEGADQVFTSGSDGKFSLGEFPDSFYMLVETKAPKGFDRPVGQWLMEVDSSKPDTSAGGFKLSFLSRSKSAMPNAVIRESLGGAFTYKIVNARPIALPLSGAGGTLPYVIGGILLMALSLAAVYARRRRRWCCG